MSLVRVVTQGGPGGIVLFFYLYGSFKFWVPSKSRFTLIFIAVVLAYLLPLLIELLSDQAISFISYPIIKDAKRKIDEQTGDEDFYFSHEDKQDKLDEYDDKVYRYTVLTYSGSTIFLTLPIQGYFFKGILGFISALGYASLFLIILSYLPYRNLRKIIKTSVRLYE